LLVVGVTVAAIIGRLIEFQGVDGKKFRTLSEEQNVQTLPIPSLRGEITSSDGTVLAMTVQTDQVAADPPLIED
jgi:cell division protein FtsI (penicillin-binding protein 3)